MTTDLEPAGSTNLGSGRRATELMTAGRFRESSDDISFVVTYEIKFSRWFLRAFRQTDPCSNRVGRTCILRSIGIAAFTN